MKNLMIFALSNVMLVMGLCLLIGIFDTPHMVIGLIFATPITFVGWMLYRFTSPKRS